MIMHDHALCVLALLPVHGTFMYVSGFFAQNACSRFGELLDVKRTPLAADHPVLPNLTQHGSDEEEEHDDPATLMAAAAQEVRSNPDGILMLQCKVGEEAGADPTWELQKEVAYVVADFVGAPLEKQEDLSMYESTSTTGEALVVLSPLAPAVIEKFVDARYAFNATLRHKTADLAHSRRSADAHTVQVAKGRR